MSMVRWGSFAVALSAMVCLFFTGFDWLLFVVASVMALISVATFIDPSDWIEDIDEDHPASLSQLDVWDRRGGAR